MLGPDDHAFLADRRRMIARQLRSRGVTDERVLAAFDDVPRELFVVPERRGEAYADRALPIECGQTISQPYIVGLMSQALELSGDERVLEVGTGSGYQAAILARLAREVVSIERHAPLSLRAGAVLDGLGIENVRLIVGDGTRGAPDFAPFDRIIVTAFSGRIPRPLWDQLREDGVLVIPLGDETGQTLVAVRKQRGEPVVTKLSPCRFVPLVGDAAGAASDG